MTVDLNSMASRARRSAFLGEVWRIAEAQDLAVEEVLAALSTESDRLVQRLLRNVIEELSVSRPAAPAFGGMDASLQDKIGNDTHPGTKENDHV